MKKLLIPPVAKAAAKDTAPSHLPRNRHTPPLPFPHRQACVFAFPCNTCLFCVCVLFNYSRKRIYIYIYFLFVRPFTAFVSQFWPTAHCSEWRDVGHCWLLIHVKRSASLFLQVAGRKLENGPQETWPPTSVPVRNSSSGFIFLSLSGSF